MERRRHLVLSVRGLAPIGRTRGRVPTEGTTRSGQWTAARPRFRTARRFPRHDRRNQCRRGRTVIGFATASGTKMNRSSDGGGFGGGGGQSPASSPWGGQAAQEPAGDAWSGGSGEEPPF